MTTFSMHVTLNFPNGEEKEFNIDDNKMSQGALEDAIISVIEGNYDASSYCLVIVRHNN